MMMMSIIWHEWKGVNSEQGVPVMSAEDRSVAVAVTGSVFRDLFVLSLSLFGFVLLMLQHKVL
jgi:hypothetical protein